MIPIVCIVGRSGSGKTTLIEKLIPELKRSGYQVATIKHDTHGFEVDKEGKDSWRHKQAGAKLVIISSSKKIALIEDVERDSKLEELRQWFIKDADIILTEGYKRSPHPKIEVSRSELHPELLCTREDNLIAIASDQKFDLGVPFFDLNDAKGLARLIEEKFLK